jgi:hypothetical protein
VRAELALVALVDALRGGGGGGGAASARGDGGADPGRVVGWWPDSGRIVRVEPHPTVLTLAADAVGLVLAGPGAAAGAARASVAA